MRPLVYATTDNSSVFEKLIEQDDQIIRKKIGKNFSQEL